MARYALPAVALLAVTAVVLVVRASLRSDSPAVRPHVSAKTTHARPAKASPAPSAPKQYYVIRSGDTLGQVASRLSTTVEALLRLNPGVEPTALVPGQQIRVK